MLSKAGSQAGVEKRQVKFTLSGGTYSIDNLKQDFYNKGHTGKHLRLKT